MVNVLYILSIHCILHTVHCKLYNSLFPDWPPSCCHVQEIVKLKEFVKTKLLHSVNPCIKPSKGFTYPRHRVYDIVYRNVIKSNHYQ